MFKNQRFYLISILLLALILFLVSCETARIPTSDEEERTEPTTSPTGTFQDTETPVLYETVCFLIPEEAETAEKSAVTMLQYHWSGYGTLSKQIDNAAYAAKLTSLLQNAPETGNRLPALSDSEEAVTNESGHLPASPGTLWLETKDSLFRLTDDYRSLCRVEYHLGEGAELEMSPELRTWILNLWNYYPYEYYSGTYKDGKLIIGQRFAAKTTAVITVKDLHVATEYDEESTITLEISSSIDQELRISLDCRQSLDHHGIGDSETVEIKARETRP